MSTFFRHNHQIRISPIRLIDQNDEMKGIVPTSEALRLAQEAGLDLVEVAPMGRPPVCKILDYGKWKYQQQKKTQKSRSHSKAGQLKEVKIKTVRIGDHDLQIKINHAKEFLEEGNKVQFTLQFRGREMAHQDLGYALFRKVKEGLYSVSKVEQEPRTMGKRMSLVLMPGKTVVAVPDADKPAAPARAGASLGIPQRPATAAPSVPSSRPGAAPAAPRPAAAPASGAPATGGAAGGTPPPPRPQTEPATSR